MTPIVIGDNVKILKDNHPPDAPKVTGPYFNHAGIPYECTIKAIDPDGDNVSYQINWDDGDISDWTDWYPSGEKIKRSHTYSSQGDFEIRARAKDTHGAIGDWGYITFGISKGKQNMLDNLRFMCTAPYGLDEKRYNYYKEKLLSQYESDNSNDDIVCEPEQEESKIPIVSPPAIMGIGPKDTPWPMKCHDLHHTGRSPYSTVDNPYIEKWRFYNDGWIQDTPVIDDDGTVYFGGCFGGLPWYLFAIYPDGTEKWKYKTDGLILGSSPAIADDGTIYVGSWDDNLHAINPDGTRKWRFPADDIYSSPIIAVDGTIYFGVMGPGNNGRIYAVNPDGTEKWHYDTGYWITSDPAIGDDGTVYIGSQDNYLYALWPNGTLRWRFGTGSMIMGPPSIADDGTIYIGSWDDYLYALYPNGTMKWKCKIGSGTAVNPSIASDGTIYSESDNNLYAIYPNGTLKWSFDLGPERHIMGSSPAISADGTIYVGTNIGESAGGEIIAVNSDGTERWRKRIADKWVDSSPSIAEDGTVYIGSAHTMDRGYLHAFGNVESNSPPNSPTISGQTQGKVGEEYRYTLKAVDPDNNPLCLFVDWDDGDSGWVGTRASGELCYFSHTWTTQGDYTIKAKVKDVMDEESEWATFDVKIERKSREVQQMLFYRLLEQFPILQKILCRIL